MLAQVIARPQGGLGATRREGLECLEPRAAWRELGTLDRGAGEVGTGDAVPLP